jgi:uncharacterized membrane protein (DUF106 family)
MDAFLDTLWLNILAGLDAVFNLVSGALVPLHFLGPALLILLITLALVACTKTLSRIYTTKRYRKLKENYEHWFEVRRQAMNSEDPEKGKTLAKNIDQAELNKAYYDYFFEGFLKNILTTILPMLLVAAFVVKAYKPANLMETFGRTYIFKFSNTAGQPVVVGAFFWFVISLLTVHIVWFVVARVYKKRLRSGEPEDR